MHSYSYTFNLELPSDKAWGRTKRSFYDADVADGDIYGKSTI